MSTGLQQSFFLGAPATKLLSFASVLAYVLIHAKNAHSRFAMDTTLVLQGQWYRLFTAHITFGSTGELVLGTMTVAHFSRRFEREMGTRKFLMWLVEVYLLAIPLIWTVAIFISVDIQYAGPYPELGALLYLYYRYTPRLHPRFFGVFGFHVSEKAIPYMFALQMILYQGLNTVIPTVCGGVCGYFAIQYYTMDVPDGIADFVSYWFGQVVEEPPGMLAPRPARQERVRARGGAQQRGRVAPPPQVPPPQPQPPSQEAIEQLTAMGFDRDTVVRALQQSNNSVERALDRLLSGT